MKLRSGREILKRREIPERRQQEFSDDKGQNEDSLSYLPNDLLFIILSLLPTKDSVATSVLSTRWKSHYTSVNDLYFQDSPLGTATTSTKAKFIDFVPKVIDAVVSKSNYIRKLHLHCSHGPYTGKRVASWICKVLGAKLQDLRICIQNRIRPMPLPPRLFDCKALTSMEIRVTFLLCVPEHVVFPNLKSLTMSLLIIPNDVSLQRFFSGCVVLERLDLSRCVIDSIRVFKVSIASLRYLSMVDISGHYKLLLNTPNLESFKFEGYATKGYSGKTLTGLTRAEVNIVGEYKDYKKTSRMMKLVSNATSLWLGKDTMECLVLSKEMPFKKLTKLSLDPDDVEGWMSLQSLLVNSPCLEVLEFVCGLSGSDDLDDVVSYLPDGGVSTHLKEVIFRYFFGEEYEFDLVEYFLSNAQVLEKISISPYPTWDSDSDMTKRLLELQRSYKKTCRIVFD